MSEKTIKYRCNYNKKSHCRAVAKVEVVDNPDNEEEPIYKVKEMTRNHNHPSDKGKILADKLVREIVETYAKAVEIQGKYHG